MNFKNILPYIGLVIVLLLWGESCQKQGETRGLYEDAQAKLELSVNAQGQQTGRIKLLEAENAKALLAMESSDENSNALKGIVEEFKGKLYSPTRLVNQTTESGSTATSVTNKGDTIQVDGVDFVYPQYSTEWDEQWTSGLIIATKDSIFRDIKIRNEYEITQGRERLGFLKGKETVITIKNLNPYTETEELRTFRVKENKRISFGVQLGVGVTQHGIGWYGGVGVQYKLIEL